jgi:hypothetical protein
MPHVRICAGGWEQSQSLPRPARLQIAGNILLEQLDAPTYAIDRRFDFRRGLVALQDRICPQMRPSIPPQRHPCFGNNILDAQGVNRVP